MDDQEATNVYKDASEKLLETLKDNFGSQFREYFYGDPFAIPQSQLPCLIVDLDTSTQQLGPTGFDRVDQSIIVKVAFNKRDDFGGDKSTSVTKRKLKLMMEARDATTKQYLPESVLGVVRKFFTLNNQIENQVNSQIVYGVVNRAFTEKTADVLTAEAQLTIQTSELVQVDNRA